MTSSRDSKGLKDYKENLKKDDLKSGTEDPSARPLQKISPLSKIIPNVYQFKDHKITAEKADDISNDLKKLNRLNLLIELINKLPKEEIVELQKEKENLINSLTGKIIKAMLDENISKIQLGNKAFGDVLYDAAIALSYLYPRNDRDFISLTDIDDIPLNNRFYSSDRFVMDLTSLVEHINHAGNFKHPQHRTPFNSKDIEATVRLAEAHNPSLIIKINYEKKSGSLNPTALDQDAIDNIQAQNRRDAEAFLNNVNALFAPRSVQIAQGEIEEYPRFITYISEQIGVAPRLLSEWHRQADRRFFAIQDLVPYLENDRLRRQPSLTLNEVFAMTDQERSNLWTTFRFIQAGVLTINEAKNFSEEERRILAITNSNNPNDIPDLLAELRIYQNRARNSS